MNKVLSIILTLGIILGVGGYFLVKESYAATPADPLFAVQEIADDVQRAFTFDDVAKTELEQDILVRRQEQVEKMSEREDIPEEKMEEGLELMVQQRERVRERLQIVEQTEVNEKTREVIQDVQKRYDENLDKQLKTIDKVQEKYSGVGQSVEEDTVREATERGRNVQEEIIEEVEEVGEGRGNAPDDLEEPEIQNQMGR